MSDQPVTYGSYLRIPQLLDCQHLLTDLPGRERAHDEHLFIVVHQAFELWFKQVIWELDSIRDFFKGKNVERQLFVINIRMERINRILKMITEHFGVLETMTPPDFVNFRRYLESGSGFQSLQFRLLENKIGLQEELRDQLLKDLRDLLLKELKAPEDVQKYNYKCPHMVEPSSKEQIEKSLEDTLLKLVDTWLQQIAKLDVGFWDKFKQSVKKWQDYKGNEETFDNLFNAEKYKAEIKQGKRRLSYQGFQGALMIMLYREEPRFNQPYKLLTLLMDMDSLLSKWRFHHVKMVHRMIGEKMGTGGTSGVKYLRLTTNDTYSVFVDLFNASTFLIPRESVPPLSENMKRHLAKLCSAEDTTSQ